MPPSAHPASSLESLLQLQARDLLADAASEYDRLSAPHPDRIVLFGAGELGQITLHNLRKAGREPLAFVDNNPALWNRDVGGITVLSPSEGIEKWNSTATFVVTVYTTGPVVQQLASLGCHRVVHYAYLFARHRAFFLPFLCLGQPEKIFAEAEDVRRGYRLFESGESQQAFLTQLKRRLFLEFGVPPVAPPPELRATEYFPPDLYKPDEQEVFVDCGAYDGDTLRRFLELRRGMFGSILAVEPDPTNFDRLRSSVTNLPDQVRSRIQLRKLAASDRQGTLRFSGVGTVWAGASPEGEIEVEAQTLDHMFGDLRPTLIKMDLEGGEIEALRGARRSIAEFSPVLAITVYHRVDHLWRIPLLIESMRPGYAFFLRAHAPDCWDVSCYAVPPERLVSTVP